MGRLKVKTYNSGALRYHRVQISVLNAQQIATRYHPQLLIVLEILRVYNPRISEILSAKYSNYTKGKFLILEGRKRSRNIVIRDRFILESIDKLEPVHKDTIFPLVSYNDAWRAVQELYPEVVHRTKKNHNRHVTHGFRFLNVSSITNDKKVRDILHHSSVASGKYYQPNLKESKQ